MPSVYNGKRYHYAGASVPVARSALRLGPLVRNSIGHYVSHAGGRSFSQQTIARLIAAGEAVPVGNGVVHVEHVRTAMLSLSA